LSSGNEVVIASTVSSTGRSKDSLLSGTDADKRVSGSPREGKYIIKMDIQTISTANTVVAKRAMAVRRDRMRILTEAVDFFVYIRPNLYISLVQMVGIERIGCGASHVD
jgi:hypothetical protein